MLRDLEPCLPVRKPLDREVVLDIVAQVARLLFVQGQTTERVVVAAERLGNSLGQPIKVLPAWGELAVEIEGTTLSRIISAAPLGVDMDKVLAVMTIVDQACEGMLPAERLLSSLAAAEQQTLVSAPRFALFAALGAAALGVIFGALSSTSLLLIAASACIGALVRRWVAKLGGNPLVQALCAASIAGVVAAVAGRLNLSDAPSLVAFCPCMVLVPGPHILNGAIDLARTRIAIGMARLTYAVLIVLMICAGLLFGIAAAGTSLSLTSSSISVALIPDVIAAGFAVAAFGTFFSMPLRLLPFPIAVGMLAHAARWAVITLGGAHVAVGALVACTLVGIIVTPVVDRLRLPFAALGFSAVVSMMPGFFLFHAANAFVELLAMGEHAPVSLVKDIFINGATAFVIVLAMTSGLIIPRMLFERFAPTKHAGKRSDHLTSLFHERKRIPRES